MSGLWSCVTDPVHCVTSSSLSGVGGSIISALSSWLTGDAHAWLTITGHLLTATTAPHVITAFVKGEYQRVATLAPLLLLGAILINVIAVLWRGGGVSSVVTTLKFVPVAVMGVIVAPALAELLLRFVDAICGVVGSGVNDQLNVAASRLGAGTSTASFVAMTLLFLLTAILLWVELTLRTIGLALILCALPILAAMTVWDPARRTALRLVEAFVALAVTKIVVTLALCLGLAGMSSSSGAEVLVGTATLLLAALSPYLVLRLVPVASHAAVHATSGLRQRAVATVAGVGQHPVVQATSALLPEKLPPLEERGEDLGLNMWPGIPEVPMPPINDGPRPRAPIIVPPVRHGRPVVKRDAFGPVMGWEWDDD